MLIAARLNVSASTRLLSSLGLEAEEEVAARGWPPARWGAPGEDGRFTAAPQLYIRPSYPPTVVSHGSHRIASSVRRGFYGIHRRSAPVVLSGRLRISSLSPTEPCPREGGIPLVKCTRLMGVIDYPAASSGDLTPIRES